MGKDYCPLISRYGVAFDEPAWGSPFTDWIKLICLDYCPLDKCILDIPRLKRGESNEILTRITLSSFITGMRNRIPTLSSLGG